MDRSDSEAFFSKHYRKISAIRNYMSSQLILKIERYDPEIFIIIIFINEKFMKDLK